MRRSGRIIMLLGLVLGLITAGLAFYFLFIVPPVSPTSQAVETVQIIVAEQPIAPRGTIQRNQVNPKSWPKEFVPPGAITDVTRVVNRLAATRIEQGQPIVATMLISRPVPVATGSDASYIIPVGKVAVAFPINPIAAVAGGIREGDFVDLIVSYPLAAPANTPQSNTPQSTVRQVTQYALQNVEILRIGAWPATGQGSQADANRDLSVVTFVVDPQDALVLKFLRETATEVQFALRAAGDTAQRRTEPVIIEYIDQRFGFNGFLGRSR